MQQSLVNHWNNFHRIHFNAKEDSINVLIYDDHNDSFTAKKGCNLMVSIRYTLIPYKLHYMPSYEETAGPFYYCLSFFMCVFVCKNLFREENKIV